MNIETIISIALVTFTIIAIIVLLVSTFAPEKDNEKKIRIVRDSNGKLDLKGEEAVVLLLSAAAHQKRLNDPATVEDARKDKNHVELAVLGKAMKENFAR